MTSVPTRVSFPTSDFARAMPQVGWQVYPTGFVSRARTFLNVDYQAGPSGAVIARGVEAGLGLVTRFSGSLQFRYIDNHTRAGSLLIGRRQFGYNASSARRDASASSRSTGRSVRISISRTRLPPAV